MYMYMYMYIYIYMYIHIYMYTSLTLQPAARCCCSAGWPMSPPPCNNSMCDM